LAANGFNGKCARRVRYNSTNYPGWIWKGDTSSDEIVGHVLMHATLGALVPPPAAAAATDAAAADQADAQGRGLRGGSGGGSGSGGSSGGGVLGRQALFEQTLAPCRAEAAEVLGGMMSAIIANG
jgi:hypothetical protein